jgi:Tfp pilus assembly protein PilV
MSAKADKTPVGCGRRSLAQPRVRSAGVVLILVLVFLLLIGVATGTALNTATLELRMARNIQFRVQAQQYAQAILDAVAANPEHFPLDSDVGQLWCARVDDAPDCDQSTVLQLPVALENTLSGVTSRYQVRRVAPAQMEYRPRQAAVEEEAHPVAVFETRVVVDGNRQHLARAELVQGLIRTLPGELNIGATQEPEADSAIVECAEEGCSFAAGELKRIYWHDPGIDRD